LVDFRQFDSFKALDAAGQRAWYEKLLKEGEEKNEPETPAGEAVAALQETAPTPAVKPAGGKITLAKPATGKPAAATPPAPPAPKPAPSAAKTPPPPPQAAKTAPNPAHAAWEKACAVLDPWGVALGESENVDQVVEIGISAEYQIDQEMLDAALLVQAGEPEKTVTLAKTPPPPPPAAKPAPTAPAADAGDDADVPALQARLLQLTKSSPVLKNFKNMSTFAKTCFGGAKAVGKIEDAELLASLIEICENGDDAIKEAAGITD
jgi:hypothetical protein